METAKTLDLTRAQQFLEDPESLDLCEVTEITEAAAESLSKFEGESLGFNAPENGQRSSNQLSRIQSGKRGNSIFLTKKLPTLIS